MVQSRRAGATANRQNFWQKSQGAWYDPAVRGVWREEEMGTTMTQQPELVGDLRTLFLYGVEGLQTSAKEETNGSTLRPEPAFVQQDDHEGSNGYPMSMFMLPATTRRVLTRMDITVKRASTCGLWNVGQKETHTLGFEPLPDVHCQYIIEILEVLTR